MQDAIKLARKVVKDLNEARMEINLSDHGLQDLYDEAKDFLTKAGVVHSGRDADGP